MRGHFRARWWAWLAIAAAVIAVNEAVDRNFFDHREHIDGDVVLAVLGSVIAFVGSYALARRKSGS